MRVQTILAHPLAASFTAAVRQRAAERLRAEGHEVIETDLYGEGFEPALTPMERAGYFEPVYDTAAVQPLVDRLRRSDALVLCFPHWWFDSPAVLKGYFDRVWAPGVAFRHDRMSGRILPLLERLRSVTVLTSFGSPWWLVELHMRNPARRILKRGVLAACAPRASFHYHCLYDMDRATAAMRARHLERVDQAMRRL